MSFTSLYFFPFVVIVLAVYWLALPKKAFFQNALLLLSSLVFIGVNDWQASILIAVSGILNLLLVRHMNNMEEGNSNKWFFYAGCLANILLLCLCFHTERRRHRLQELLFAARHKLFHLSAYRLLD